MRLCLRGYGEKNLLEKTKAEQWIGMCVQHIRGNSYLKTIVKKNNIFMNIHFLEFFEYTNFYKHVFAN